METPTAMKALVTGATGFVGPRLLRLLDQPVVLTRNPERARPVIGTQAGRIIRWDPMEGPPPPEAYAGVDVIFHLAGESVAEGRWTAAQKARIRDSRVIGTRHLVQGLAQVDPGSRPKVLVSASAVGYYGDRGDEELTESAAPADDFLARVCIEWEREALAAETHGLRVALARTGIVLGAGGGALGKMLTPFKLGAGGPLGNGKQWMPWVHVADLARLYVHAAENGSIRGPMNSVAPHPVRNSEFTKALGRQLHRPAFMPAPYIGLRLLFGEFAQVLFASQRVIPKLALDTGFVFQYPDIAAALREILGKAA
jgi:uncharacterized protein (TIGR01777 family)